MRAGGVLHCGSLPYFLGARSVPQPLAAPTTVQRPCKGPEHGSGLTLCRVPFQHAKHVPLCGQEYEILVLALQPRTVSSDKQPHDATKSAVRGTAAQARQSSHSSTVRNRDSAVRRQGKVGIAQVGLSQGA